MSSEFERTQRHQADASDPRASAWVSANAGAGKTHVLALRVLRLLLEGEAPERILCLTYTKAAAAEMSKRVFDTLGRWATLADGALAAALNEALSRPATTAEKRRARNLFAQTIETPGGLKVQTIHAFAEKLLQRFPLEAGVTPGFKILDDGEARRLKLRAIDGALTAATGRPASPLGRALSAVTRFAADANFDALLSKAIDQRQWLDSASRLDLGAKDDDFAAAEALLRRTFRVADGATIDALAADAANVFRDSELAAFATELKSGNASDNKNASAIRAALGAPTPMRRMQELKRWLLKSDDQPRVRLLSAQLAAARPDLAARASDAQQRFFDAVNQVKALELVIASAALYRLAGAVLKRYSDAKHTAGALDFDDLIWRTTRVLTGRGGAEWVLFKLDGGLDHILVDEAQDTSPDQWAIIEALAREFFAGAGARDGVRTLFAVGDEKQSIYSFQGAAPERFAEMGSRFAALAAQAARPMRRVPLTLSFRSVAPVLDAVDRVFADPVATPGLNAAAEPVRHAANRLGQSGFVELWPRETYDAGDAGEPWRPLDDGETQAPAIRLANRIAEKIKVWLTSGEILASEERAVRAGDILILVRKRRPFATAMVAALKRRGIPVAGADRMTLIEQIAVQDLMALGDFLTLPEDDLALASVLKSPMFDLDDDDLLSFAHGRKGALWKALLAHADATPKLQTACETLKRWRAKADFAPPFEFFASVLDRDGMRQKLLCRIGPDAADALDEFLDAAIAFDDRDAPSMTGFLAALRAENADVKRDMDLARNEVRVMTVHGAKGLEAPIVFLPDTCTTASGDTNAARLLALDDAERPAGLPAPVIWPVKGSMKLDRVRRASDAGRRREAEERNRLLYVAMTRAKDRLYVAGFEGSRLPDDCWYFAIENAFKPIAAERDDGDGRTVWRIESAQTAPPQAAKAETRQAIAPVEPPEFARRRARHEPRLTVPLAPSRLEPYAPDAEGEPVLARAAPDPATSGDVPSPRATSDSIRFLRGTLTHALLQHLPEIEPGRRQLAAEAFVARRGQQLNAAARRSIVSETLAILDDGAFAPLFAPGSRAEVAVAAELPRPAGSGPALRLSGSIDRLAVTESDVLIVDYKTNRPPPREVAAVADAYLLQIAAYTLALREVYPGKTVRAALLWTDGPRLMAIPDNVIENAIQRLWTLDVASLDAP